jgi:hypothetical protein
VSLFEDRGAVLSEDRRYRYVLWRRWDPGLPQMVWILLNPSTADERADDQTLRKCVGFAQQFKQGGIQIVNLFAWRSRHPNELQMVADPIGPENDTHILKTLGDNPGLVMAGWGADRFARRRAEAVTAMVKVAHPRLTIRCLGRGVAGTPTHPLFVPYWRVYEVYA